MSIVRIAVVGLGHVARHVHLPLLSRLDEHFRVTAVCDSQPGYAGDVAARYGLAPWAAFTDAEAMFASGGFDAIMLLTSGSHAQLAVMALGTKLPVFCEKPLAHYPVEAQDVADAGGQLMVGYMKQYDPRVTAARADLDPAAIRHIDISVLHPPERFPDSEWDPAPAEPQVHHGDRARWEYRALLDSVCHDLALIRLFSGVADLAVDAAASWGAADDEPGSLEFSGPLPHGRYSVRWHYLPDHAEYRGTVAVHHTDGSTGIGFADPYFFGREGSGSGFERELLAFHLMVTDGTPPLSGVAEASADIRTALRVLDRLPDPRP